MQAYYSLAQSYNGEIFSESTLLLISFFALAITIIIFYLLSKEHITFIFSRSSSLRPKDEGKIICNNDSEKINYLFDYNNDNFKEILKLRNSENMSVLQQAATLALVISIFFLFGKATLEVQSNLSFFLPLTLYLAFAFVCLLISFISLFSAIQAPFKLPPNLFDYIKSTESFDEKEIKNTFIKKWVSVATANYVSNKRKMDLMYISRKYLLYSLIFLLISLIFFVLKIIIT